MALQPWYKVVYPREDLREGKPLDASEFAVHLDQVRDGRANADYQDPARFFSKNYLTKNLLATAAEVVRRLSGMKTETSAVFNMTTQFGGGKTHALTLLYHLANAGPEAKGWPGVSAILERAGVAKMPKAEVGVFVGTEFDSITGRGGKDGTPLRKTPWGELAFQLGGKAAFEVVAEHDRRFTEPKGDVIRAFLPKDRPCLILMDEIISYVKRFMRGFELTADTLGLEVIAKVGAGGGYLNEKHTFKHWRNELWHPALMNRDNPDGWQAKGCKTYGEVVTEKALSILATHRAEPLPAEIRERLAAIVRQAEQDLAGLHFKA